MDILPRTAVFKMYRVTSDSQFRSGNSANKSLSQKGSCGLEQFCLFVPLLLQTFLKLAIFIFKFIKT